MGKGILSWFAGLFSGKPQKPSNPAPAPVPPSPPVFKLPPTTRPLPAPAPTISTQQQLLDAHNASRATDRPLRLNASLCIVATRYASLMAAKHACDHNLDGKTLFVRFQDGAYAASSAGENIAAGQTTIQAVMSSWLGSAGHRSNLRNPDFVDVGFGVCQDDRGVFYWCADFARPAMRIERRCPTVLSGAIKVGPATTD